VADEAAHLELLRALHLERGVEAHLQVPMLVLVKDLLEALLEDTHLEAVDEQLVPVRDIAQRMHLEQADLVQAARKHVNRMPIRGSAAAQVLVEAHRALKELDVVLLDVVVRANSLAQLGRDDLSGALRAGPTAEEHHARARVLERTLKQADCDAERSARAALRALVVRHGPRVALQLLEDARQLVLALRHRKQEARRADLAARCRARLRWAAAWRRPRAGREAQHVLDTLGRVVLRAAEYKALGAVLVAQFVHLNDRSKRHQADERVRRQQTEADHERLAERLEIIRLHACVDHEHEDGRDLRRAAQRVLDRRVLGQQLRGQIGRANVLVVRRERVARQAERADPQLATHVHLAVRVQHRAARRLAHHRLVQDRRQVSALLKRRVQRCDGDDGARRLQLRRRPYIPR